MTFSPDLDERSRLPHLMVSTLARLDIDVRDVRIDTYAAGLGKISRVFSSLYVVDVAVSQTGRHEIALEFEGRNWARTQGVSVAKTLEYQAEIGVLVTERCRPAPRSGPHFIDQAIAAAEKIASSSNLPQKPHVDRRWGSSKKGRLKRLAKVAQGGLPMMELRAARASALRLPATHTAHGDFHPGNLLYDRRSNELVVIDWANLGQAPQFTDLVRLWGQVRVADDRARIEQHLLACAYEDGREGRRALKGLWPWFALRQLAEYYADPDSRPENEENYEEFLWHRLTEARRYARDLGRLSA